MKPSPKPRDTTLQPAAAAAVVEDTSGAGIAVRLCATRHSGARRVGAMEHGKAYTVAPAEAVRLVEHKGLVYATPADSERAAAWKAAQARLAAEEAAAKAKAAEATNAPAAAAGHDDAATAAPAQE